MEDDEDNYDFDDGSAFAEGDDRSDVVLTLLIDFISARVCLPQCTAHIMLGKMMLKAWR